MPDGTKAQSLVDPIELWRQWNETTSRMWLSTIDSGKEATTDPSNFYQSWVKSVKSAQEQMKQNPLVMGSSEMWKMWFSSTMEIWKQASATTGDPLGLTAGWLKLMEDAQNRFLAGEVLPSDPFTLFRQWYNATNEQWSKSIEQVIGSDQFLEATAPFTESYTSLVRAFRHASEAYFKQLQLPTLSDIARVAELVINLEEKVDKIEDVFADFAEQNKQLATSKAVALLEKRVEGLVTSQTIAQLEKKVDGLASSQAVTHLEKRVDGLATSAAVTHLEKRIDGLASSAAITQLEERIDGLASSQTIVQLEKRVDGLATSAAVTHLEKEIEGLATSKTVTTLQKRLDQVEHKLDLVLSTLEKIADEKSNDVPAQAGSQGPASRKGQKKASASQETAPEA